jgi:hypothetical protein
MVIFKESNSIINYMGMIYQQRLKPQRGDMLIEKELYNPHAGPPQAGPASHLKI